MAERLPENRRPCNSAAGVDVVVLKHGAVGKIETVVFAAAADNGVFLKGAKPGKGLFVSAMLAFVPETRPTHLAVSVAMPDIC